MWFFMDGRGEAQYNNTGNNAGQHYGWSRIMAATAKKPEVIVEEPEAKVDTTVELEIPEGGIGGFAMSEEDFAILEAEEATKEFGEFGLAQFTSVAQKMAGHGRYGDDSVAHIQTGEMVVPLTLLEKNPALKAQIFEQLRESGIEDPEQYVVGSKANNINPETGLMEFGFFSNLWSGVKKVFKAVVKVVKKVAPIVLPIVLSMTPLGPIYGAAMGSGIATLVNGGSIGDALKSALISGATGAAVSGMTGDAGFFENISNAAADPLARAGATWEGAKSSFSGEGFTGEGSLFADYIPTAEIPSTDPTAMDKAGDYMFRGGESTAEIANAATAAEDAYLAKMTASGITPTEAGLKAAAATAAPGMLATYGPSIAAGTAVMAAAGGFKTPEEEDLDLVRRNADGTVTTGSDLIAGDPSKYLVHDLGSRRLNPETGEYEEVDDYTVTSPDTPMYTAPTMPTDYMPDMGQYMGEYVMESTPGGPFRRPDPITYQAAAQGGPIFPRRNGGIAPTEGVEGQDSVRAMLMPGEFVMTTDAVRGLGDGNLNNGIKSMYSVMRNLESRGRDTA